MLAKVAKHRLNLLCTPTLYLGTVSYLLAVQVFATLRFGVTVSTSVLPGTRVRILWAQQKVRHSDSG